MSNLESHTLSIDNQSSIEMDPSLDKPGGSSENQWYR